VYDSVALVPATPWLGGGVPAAPQASMARAAGGYQLTLAGPGAVLFGVWARYGRHWRFATVPASRPVWLVPDDASAGPAGAVLVSSVDRVGIESERVPVAVAKAQ
jgi:hypothetical protein